MRHGVVASKYWDMGDDDREYRYNNYISRYHMRHLDLMDLMALYQPRANAPLDAMARLCGFPGKLGMDGSQVFDAYREGRIDEIRRYCETDVMNTYLLYCRFQQMRGGFSDVEYRREIGGVREMLAGLDEPHWHEYLDAWPVEPPVAETPAPPPAPVVVAASVAVSATVLLSEPKAAPDAAEPPAPLTDSGAPLTGTD